MWTAHDQFGLAVPTLLVLPAIDGRFAERRPEVETKLRRALDRL